MYPLGNTGGSCTVGNGPLKIIKWKGKQTEAIGWIVIHSLINDIAGGGLFMHAKATLEEVSDLAKSMSYKNCIIKNPQMGGAKGGIKFDANHPEAQNVLARFLIDNKAIIENLWCTRGDLDTNNEIIETIVKKELGFPSAFVCLARSLSKVEQIPDQSANISARITTPLNELFNIGQCATGYSVCQTIKLVTNNTPRVLIQGFGKVGSSLAYFLQSLQLGIIVGICERDGYIYNENGIDATALIKARLSSQYNPLFPLKSLLNPEQCSQYHWTPAASSSDKTLNELLNNINADVLSPCAERYSINEGSINRFINHKN